MSEPHSHAGHSHDDHSDHAHASHPHGHSGHHHGPTTFNRAFAIGVTLNLLFVGVEVVYGLSADSLALISDAGHNASDVLGLFLAWGALRLTQSKRTARRTYGLRRTSILAALGNAALLLFVTGAVTWEAIIRFRDPTPVVATTIIWVALVGIVINGVTAMLFFSGRKSDMNIRGAFLHLASDALVAAGVVIAGFLIRSTGWLWVDPVVSIVIGLVILVGTWGLLRESLNLAMDAVPESIDPAAVEAYLSKIPGVTAVHDLHIWAMSTTETALTAHLIVPGERLSDEQLLAACTELRERFKIGHVTMQSEQGEAAHPPGHDHAKAI